MDRCENPRWFIPSKYSQKLKPWEIVVRIKNNLTENNCSLKYKYSIKHDSMSEESTSEWEREPSNMMTFMKPQEYKG